MRVMPYLFSKTKNLQNNMMIDLVLLEDSTAYVSEIDYGTKGSVRITTQLQEKFVADSITPSGSGTGYAWIATFESGRNVGTSRIITSYSVIGGRGFLNFDVPLQYTPSNEDSES